MRVTKLFAYERPFLEREISGFVAIVMLNHTFSC